MVQTVAIQQHGSNRADAQLIARYASRGVNKERLKALRQFGGQTILDVGCGSGAYIFELAEEREIHGVDLEPYPQWERMPDRFSVQDACALAIAPDSVETISAFEVLEHLPDPEKVLADFYRACSKNVILTVPNCDITEGMRRSGLAHHHWNDPTHVNFFHLDTVCQSCVNVGFRIRHRGYINRMNFTHLLREAFGTGFVRERVIRWLDASRRRDHFLTCLVVAEK